MTGTRDCGYVWVEGDAVGLLWMSDTRVQEHSTFGVHEGEAYWYTWENTGGTKRIKPHNDEYDAPVFRYAGREVCLVESYPGHQGRIAARTVKDGHAWIECGCREHAAAGGGLDWHARGDA